MNSQFRTVISRADEPSSVSHLCNRSSEVLIAEEEQSLSEHLRSCGVRHVRRSTSEGSREELLSLPHFTAEDEAGSIAVYVVSVCNMAAPAALTMAQFRYCEQAEARKVCVLPCLTQHVREDKVRCVAWGLVTVREKGAWSTLPEAAQYLPAAHRHAIGIDIPCAAWYIKHRNLVQEIANHGQRLYPVVENFVHAGHLPVGMEIRGSGTEYPLMLTVTEGRNEGYLQVLHGGFYSSEHAVNELLVTAEDIDDGQPLLCLRAADGTELKALCAEWQMFPNVVWQGRQFRWALSMLCGRVNMVREGAFDPGCRGHELQAEVVSTNRCTFCGLPLCHIEARAGALIFNVYAAIYDPEAPLPEPGERICAVGKLYAVPDSLIEPPSEPEPGVAEELLPLSLPVAVVAGGLIEAGYEWSAPFKPIFRGGLPELRMISPGGERLLVLVDTVVNGRADSRGYSRYAPDFYPDRMDSVPPENLPAEVLFATVCLESNSESGFDIKVVQHGAVRSELRFTSHVDQPCAEGLSEEIAAQKFGEMMVTHDFNAMLPLLAEDIHYESETARLSLFSKLDVLRHLRSCFDNWRSRNEMPNLMFLLSSVEYDGRRRPCTVACQHGEIISATIFEIAENRIAAIFCLAGDVLDTLQPLEEKTL